MGTFRSHIQSGMHRGILIFFPKNATVYPEASLGNKLRKKIMNWSKEKFAKKAKENREV